MIQSPPSNVYLSMDIIVLILGILLDSPMQPGGYPTNSSPGLTKASAPNELLLIDTSYASRKIAIANLKLRYRSIPISTDSLSKLFTNLLVDQLIPHWLGTPWSFEGHTSIPGQGEIACGYFVSTTLRDMGLNINRYKMAQQLPIHEAKTLALNTAVIEINNTSTRARIDQLNSTLQEGIYFIGFDQSHVGYLQRKGNDLFIIHSNYINAVGVVVEKAEDSAVFSYYSHIYIAAISTNPDLMKKWINHSPIEIIMQ